MQLPKIYFTNIYKNRQQKGDLSIYILPMLEYDRKQMAKSFSHTFWFAWLIFSIEIEIY